MDLVFQDMAFYCFGQILNFQPKTTEIYTHVMRINNKTIESPLMGTKQKWYNVPGAPQVDVLQLNKKWSERNSIGFNFVRHSFATYKYNSFNIPYCFDAKINNASTIRLGLTTRIINSNIDFTQSVTENPIEPALGNYRSNTWFLDATAGIAYFYKSKVKVGAAINNFVVNGSINDNDLFDYNNYSVFQGLFDCSISVYQSNNVAVSVDYIQYLTPVSKSLSELYVKSEIVSNKYKVITGIGFKTTDVFVSFIKVSNDKNYFIFTSEINNSNSQLGFFSGNFVGIGMTMNRIKKL